MMQWTVRLEVRADQGEVKTTEVVTAGTNERLPGTHKETKSGHGMDKYE
jgi:hypothetical protein